MYCNTPLIHNTDQYSAIILAAGYSSRMQGELKALLPLGSFPHILLMAIENFRAAGIQDIHIVLGHKHDQIKEAVRKLDLCIVHNPHFATGMYSSICAGMQSVLAKDIRQTQAAFVLPVDAALVKSSTIPYLMSLWQKKQDPAHIFMPCFLKKCGHPPLIGKEHFTRILQHQGEGGLRGYFTSCLRPEAQILFLGGYDASEYPSDAMTFVPMPDEGILSDIDTLDEYKNAQDFLHATNNRQTASLHESWHLLQEANVSDRIVKHSYKVALGALRLGLALKREDIHPLYHVCGGLLHDIMRLQKDHAQKTQIFLQDLGWEDIARIVGSHTVLPQSALKAMHIDLEEDIKGIASIYGEGDVSMNPACLYASICVYLADKFFSGEHFIDIHSRFRKVKERFAADQEAFCAIQQRERVALAVCDWFRSTSKIDPELCVQTQSGHDLEKQLQALSKMHAIEQI